MIDPAKVSIRPVQQTDMRALVPLCAAHAAYEDTTYDVTDKAAHLAQLFFQENASLHGLVAVMGEELVGYATWTPQVCTWDAAWYAYMDCLYLMPKARGYGIGRRLMTKLAEEAQALGCYEVQWQTPLSNTRAIAFYERLGATQKQKARFFLRFN